MSNQTELDPKNQEAIAAALENAWSKAVTLNSELLDEYPDDVDVLNRLGKAYTELGQVNKAKSTYDRVLEIDSYNPIATKSLERLATLRGNGFKPKEAKTLDPDIFIEELGKTKTIGVVDLAMPKVLVQLRTGDSVKLNATKDGVSVISEDNSRLGKLETVWGQEIASAIQIGSKFTAIVKATKIGKTSKDSSLTIFVREIERSVKLISPPFPIQNNNFTPFVREETISYLKHEESPENNEEGEETNSEVSPDETEDDSPEPLVHRDELESDDEENPPS